MATENLVIAYVNSTTASAEERSGNTGMTTNSAANNALMVKDGEDELQLFLAFLILKNMVV